ncbi:MAG: response regulator transcription factor [Deltaproteobacteria bacterium]|nr:MAG: response regulator transcription factor [Deltaproteobacteria bacterium]
MQQTRPIRVFLADDHPLLRIGLRLSLDQREDVAVIGEAGDGFSAVEKIQTDPPDVSLIDVDMPGLSGIKAIRMLRKAIPQMKIFVLSTHNDETYIRDAMRAGADGYILKSIDVQELVRIMESFCQEGPVVSPYLVNLTLAPESEQESPEPIESPLLTPRETEILQAITEGMGNKEISESLNISTETVKSHIKRIYKKLKVKNRVEAGRLARDNNLLS